MRICTFASGSKGNCTLVSLGGKNFLVDAGISMKRICANLALSSITVNDLDGIFITHQHSDHIKGLQMLTKYYSIPVYAPRSTATHLLVSSSCPRELIHVMQPNDTVKFDCISVSSFSTSHDTEESFGYRFEGDGVFAIATDTGTVTESIVCGLSGADAVIIESNHDIDMLKYGPYPYSLKQRILSPRGHLSNSDCAQLAAFLADSGTEYIVLGHLSRDNNTPAKAFQTVNCALQGRGAHIFVAPEAERLFLEIGGDKL